MLHIYKGLEVLSQSKQKIKDISIFFYFKIQFPWIFLGTFFLMKNSNVFLHSSFMDWCNMGFLWGFFIKFSSKISHLSGCLNFSWTATIYISLCQISLLTVLRHLWFKRKVGPNILWYYWFEYYFGNYIPFSGTKTALTDYRALRLEQASG